MFKLLYSAPQGRPVAALGPSFEVQRGLFLSFSGKTSDRYGGTVFSFDPAGEITILYPFPPGNTTAYNILQTPDGLIWGDYATGQKQGAYFSMGPNGGNVKTCPTGNAGAPYFYPAAAPPNYIYDLLRPIVRQSAVFSRIDSGGTITALHTFAGSDGIPPAYAPFFRRVDGNFYGIAESS